MSREDTAQQEPAVDADLSGFPVREVPAGTVWFRAHRLALGPWWFSSTGTGRFDLQPPNGTCYLASSADVAVREVVAKNHVEAGYVQESLIKDRVVSQLDLPYDITAARITGSDCLAYGVVGSELSAAVTYAVSCRWAEEFSKSGLTGVWYSPRLSGVDDRALAVFGSAGAATHQHDGSPVPMESFIRDMDWIRVMPDPTTLDDLDVLDDYDGEN